MKRKLLVVLLCSFLFMLACNACQTTSYQEQESQNAPISNDENEIQNSNKQQEAVDVIEENQIPVFIGVTRNISSSTALKTFPQMNMGHIQTDLGVDGKGYVISLNDNMFISSDIGVFTYMNTSNPLVNTVLADFRYNELDPYYNAYLFSTENSLSTLLREDSIDLFFSTLESLGCKNTYDICCFAIDHKTLKSQDDYFTEIYGVRDSNLPTLSQWTDEEDCYFFIARPQIYDLPLFPMSYGSSEKGTMITSEEIMAIIDKNGVQFLSILNGVEIESASKDIVDVLSHSEALAIVSGQLESLLSTETYEILSLKLGYYPSYQDRSHEHYFFLPAWEAKIAATSVDEKGDAQDTYSYVFYQYIDAQYGTEIVGE